MAQPSFESADYYSPAIFAAWLEERQRRGDSNRYELLNGRIVMTPPAGWPHGSIEGHFVRIVGNFVVAKRLGHFFGSSQGFDLPSGDTVEPDVSYVSNTRWAAAPPPEPGKFLGVVPDLVVEILSVSTRSRDRGEKRGIYERNGVTEYWLVDPDARRVSLLALEGGKYVVAEVREVEGTVVSRVLGGLQVSLEDIFST